MKVSHLAAITFDERVSEIDTCELFDDRVALDFDTYVEKVGHHRGRIAQRSSSMTIDRKRTNLDPIAERTFRKALSPGPSKFGTEGHRQRLGDYDITRPGFGSGKRQQVKMTPELGWAPERHAEEMSTNDRARSPTKDVDHVREDAMRRAGIVRR
jgi:hypothetical protein